MKPLVTLQNLMSWIQLHSPDYKPDTKTKLAHMVVTFLIRLTILSTATSSITFFTKYVSSNFPQSLYAVFILIGNVTELNMSLVLFRHHDKIINLFDRLSNIYRLAQHLDDSQNILQQSNAKCNYICQQFIKVLLCGICLGVSSLSSISVVYCLIYYGEFNVIHLFHPFFFLLPWNQQTPFGYFSEIVLDWLCIEVYAIYNGVSLLFLISMCLHHQEFHQVFHAAAMKLGQSDDNQTDTQLICQLINFHNETKAFQMKTARVYSSLIFVQLAGTMLYLAIAVFELDLVLHEIDLGLCMHIYGTSLGIFILFCYCYYGKLATESYQEFADTWYVSNWPKLPVPLQKYMPLMIQNAQLPIYYTGFGVAVLNLETFCKLLRAVYTYYMAFKTAS